MKNIYFVTGNHLSSVGIRDIIDATTEVINEENLNVKIVSNIIPNAVNIILEENSREETLTIINKVKDIYPGTKIILILTEFPTYKSKVLTFNDFDQNNLVSLGVKLLDKISIIQKKFSERSFFRLDSVGLFKRVLKKYLIKNIKNITLFIFGYIKPLIEIINLTLNKIIYFYLNVLYSRDVYPNFKHLLSPILKIPLIFRRKFNNRLRTSLLYEIRYARYMKKRAEGTLLIQNNVDLFLCVHPEIEKLALDIMGIHCLNIYPILKDTDRPKTVDSKIKKLIVTGRMTKEREEVVDKYSNKINKCNSQFEIEKVGFIESEHITKNTSGILTIPQNFDWKFSSPIRTYRSIKNKLIPIVIKNFEDHPIEKFNILLDKPDGQVLLKKYNEYLSNYDEILKLYRIEIRKFNSIIINKLLQLYNDTRDLSERPLADYLKFNNPPRFLAAVGMANIVFYNGVYYYLLRTRRNFNLEKNLNENIIYFSNVIDALMYGYKEYEKNYLELVKINNLSIGKISNTYISWDQRPYKFYFGGVRPKSISELTNKENKNILYFNSLNAALYHHLNTPQLQKTTDVFQLKPKYLFSVGLFKAIKYENNYFLVSRKLKTSNIKNYNVSFSNLIELLEYYSILPNFITRIGSFDIIRFRNKFFCIPTKSIPIHLETLNKYELNQFTNFENIQEVFTYTSKNLY